MTLALAAAWELNAEPGAFELLFGRLHPLLVHFPIAFLIAAAALEGLAALRGVPRRSPGASLCLAFGVVSAAAVVGSGWLHAANEATGGGERLELHRWTGVGALLVGATAWLVGLACRRAPEPVVLRLYRVQVIVAALLVGFAGHLGAALVWGSDWLTEPFERKAPLQQPAEPVTPRSHEPLVPLAGVDEPAPIDFHREVWPILASSCVECHGPDKAKGRLRLHEREHVLGGSARGRVVEPGDPAGSELLRRVSLAAGDEDAMPPDGERLAAHELEVLRRWIAEGAVWPSEPGVLHSGLVRAGSVAAETPADLPLLAGASDEPAPIDGGRDGALATLRAAGVTVEPLARDEPGLDVSFARIDAEQQHAALAALGELGPAVRRLDLSNRAQLADGELEVLAQCTELETLRLDGTSIGDAGVAHVAQLPKLSVLNLVGTAAGDASLEQLVAAPSLERVYVWRSRVTDAGVASFVAARPDVRVVGGAEATLAELRASEAQDPSVTAPVEESAPLSADELGARSVALLSETCVGCHGPDKVRGRLRLDSRTALLERDAPVIVPGDPGASELLRRVSLPPTDVDVMPPDPPHLGAAERELLTAWIAAGAPWAELDANTPTEVVAEAAPLPVPDESVLAALRASGALAQRIAQDENAVEVSFRVPGERAGDAALATLRGLEGNLVWLDLAGTAVTDAGLTNLAGFERLERLSLERTAVGDAGVGALAGLTRLRVLNLFGTAVGDGAVEALAALPALERVHVWSSALTADGVRALRALRPQLAVLGAPEEPQPADGPGADAAHPPQ